MLTSHQCQPNELIAPAVKIDELESIPSVDEIVTVGVSCDLLLNKRQNTFRMIHKILCCNLLISGQPYAD